MMLATYEVPSGAECDFVAALAELTSYYGGVQLRGWVAHELHPSWPVVTLRYRHPFGSCFVGRLPCESLVGPKLEFTPVGPVVARETSYKEVPQTLI